MAFYTYPSNRLEYLVKILSKLMDFNDKKIFEPTQILVGSRGMQHWLSMKLAEDTGITMNLKFDMVNSFIINTCYDITNNQAYKKTYVKDILKWRILNLISQLEDDKLRTYYKENKLRKHELSSQIAEVFSKYLKYRPSWLEKWQNNKFIESSPAKDEIWQAQLWRLLVAENPKTPIEIQKQAIKKLANHQLPNDIYIFGVNAISPINLDFLTELSKKINVHILYLNPCSEYWYDLKKAKIASWLDSEEDFNIQPLLASFGNQGKSFFNQILEKDQQEFTSFENYSEDIKIDSIRETTLTNVQKNILELNNNNYINKQDDSIIISSCHSPLREIQILHDKLLEIFEKDDSLDPQDVLVMCPNIEDYAPYIESVFDKLGDKNGEYLPCSVADRTIIDSESLVASFIETLNFPDSNFEVTKIIDYLSVPALQHKFGISSEELETIKYWLNEACIHHSLDGKTYSWDWGLKRLMLGFCISDEEKILDDSLQVLPFVEYSKIENLGKLYELIELLQNFNKELKQSRTANQWQDFLLEIFDSLFKVDEQDQYIANTIKQNISKLVISITEANFNETIDLAIIRNNLTSSLSEPIINNHFLRGKVTFCSMTPMRSIPFKVVAILGLNSTNFPRKEQKISYDLTQNFPSQKGDRTKRDDDQYLFLESIISARSYLYLSYQGNSFKNNSEQEPSIILKEFHSYLRKIYNWDNFKRYPLHPFSIECYSKGYESYDNKWLNLIKSKQQDFFTKTNVDVEKPTQFSLEEIVDIFDNPLKFYSRETLSLNLDDNKSTLSDSEPFDINKLDEYNIKKSLFKNIQDHKAVENKIKNLQLSGNYPSSAITDETIAKNLEITQDIFNEINSQDSEVINLEANIQNIKLYSKINLNSNTIILTKISNIKVKDKFLLYLQCLLYKHIYNQEIGGKIIYIDNDSKKSFDFDKSKIKDIDTDKEFSFYIQQIFEFLKSPTIAHLNLLEEYLSKKSKNYREEDSYYKQYSKTNSIDFDSPVFDSLCNSYTKGFCDIVVLQKN